ncbi:glycine--tRNA ligase [Candidatus Jorgensenbacteria bacterium GWA1_54_12]|uniref:Glycine--tRNA ligase n=1 Tax=Candidatus Jorgensenbacteria bacterium GWA1_54_12 TaxID=1798468 RepID=A0A1F6BLN2_9BACT|nr:MAG: glycine--tRNA ligase [Candidatus Jorgensenbacteria bacterium GWA1_54_12]
MATLQDIVSLAKRRGFIYPGSEIYGGMAGFYDYGPLGNELKFNIKQSWWRNMVQMRDDVVGISAAIIMNPKAWEASGHVGTFSDEMFKTSVGRTENDSSVAYLRPETAGGIFVNFKNVLDSMHLKLPFGIAQIGKAFRNEINPRDFIFRTREFEQMELEYFVRPGDDEKAFDKWVKERVAWYKSIGLKNIREHEQPPEERAHYSKATIDIEYEFPFGWQEIEGIANRGNFDLTAHQKASVKDLAYFDEETKEKYLPYVIEPSAGVERIMLAVLCDAYTEEDDRVVLKLHPTLAPYKVAVFPLLANKEKLIAKAESIRDALKKRWMTAWDDRGNIGKRYRSQDEVGTPFCVTIDFDSLEQNDVTVRDRDTMEQKRVAASDLEAYLAERLTS